MLNVFGQIVDPENLKQAYFDLTGKFVLQSQASKYYAMDRAKLNDFNYTSLQLLSELSDELKSFAPISPASNFVIPKTHGGTRNIYMYTIRDRIKAEAIYRILEPIFDKYVSDYVYSYRASHPSYYAGRSVVRRYKRHYGQNYVFKADLSDYTDNMDQEILVRKIKQFKLDPGTEKLLTLYIQGQVLSGGKISKPHKGLMTGTPISGLLSNLYMNDYDSWAGKYVAMYRRIGDDMIGFDKDPKKIDLLHKRLVEVVTANKVKLNAEKVFLDRDTKPFVFLGYRFADRKIQFDPKSIDKIIISWKAALGRYPGKNMQRKIRHLKILANSRVQTLDQQFDQLVNQKMLVDDQAQVKRYSEKFFIELTKYFFGRYTPAYRRELLTLDRDMRLESLFSHFNKIHFPDEYVKK